MKFPVSLAVVLLLFAGWAFAFASATPFRTPGILLYQRTPEGTPMPTIDVGAPDELQHINYIRHLLDGKGFPVLRVDDPELGSNYQSHQPPFYYLLAAGWSKLFGLNLDPGVDSAKVPLRALNILIGMAGIAAVYYSVLAAFRRSDFAASAAAVAGLLPMMIALHGAVTNDPLLFLLFTCTAGMTVFASMNGWTTKRALIIGVLAGLACLTKTTGVILLPIIGLGLFLSRNRDSKADAKTWVIALALPLLLAAPWWIRNMNLYGDPLGLQLFTSAFQGSPQASAFIEALGGKTYWVDMVGWWTARSFVGVFGYMDIFYFEASGGQTGAWFYRAIIAILIGLSILALVKKKAIENRATEDEVPNPQMFGWIGGALFVLTVLFFLRFNAQYFQGQARYIYPAILPVAAIIGIGATLPWKNRTQIAWLGVAIFFTALDYLSYQTITNAFPLRLGP